MKIRQRRIGGWCMEHEGVEAPFEVECLGPITPDGHDRFSVFDPDDEFQEKPVADAATIEGAERLALAYHEKGGAA